MKLIKITDYYTDSDNALNLTIKLILMQIKKSFANYEWIKKIKDRFRNTGENVFFEIWNYQRNNFTYKKDVPDELIIRPDLLDEFYKKGDCDDYAAFTYAVLKILNFKPKILLLGEQDNIFEHICIICNGIIIDAINDKFNSIPDQLKFFKLLEL